MALSNLTSYNETQYKALSISSFAETPTITTTGDINSANASVSLGGWVNNNLIAFTVNNGLNMLVSTVLTANGGAVAITITSFSPANPGTTYWTVDLGANARGTDWSLQYNVAGNGKTGTWKFVKGKMTTEPKKKDN